MKQTKPSPDDGPELAPADVVFLPDRGTETAYQDKLEDSARSLEWSQLGGPEVTPDTEFPSSTDALAAKEGSKKWGESVSSLAGAPSTDLNGSSTSLGTSHHRRRLPFRPGSLNPLPVDDGTAPPVAAAILRLPGAFHVGGPDTLEPYYVLNPRDSGSPDRHGRRGVQEANVFSTPASEEEPKPNQSKKQLFAYLVVGLLLLGLAVGLGVGFSARNKKQAPPPETVVLEHASFSPSLAPTTSLQLGGEWLQLGQDLDGESAFDLFGQWVSLSGDGNTLAIASTLRANQPAFIRMYRLDDATNWIQVGETLYQGVPSVMELSFDGSRMIIGTTSLIAGVPGHAQVYELSDSLLLKSWVPLGPPIVSGTEKFGNYVSIAGDGSGVAVTDFADSSTVQDPRGGQVGLVYLFRWNPELGIWAQFGQPIAGEASTTFLDYSVSLNFDGFVVATSATETVGRTGYVRVYEVIYDDGEGDADFVWIQRGSDFSNAVSGAIFGSYVAISHNGAVVAVGQPVLERDTQVGGKVFVFEFDESLSDWKQRGDTIRGDSFDAAGWSLSINGDGNVVAFGAPRLSGVIERDPGYVSVIHWVKEGAYWEELGPRQLPAEDVHGVDFGWSVSLSADGQTLAVGDPHNDAAGLKAGSIRIFELA